MVLSLYVIFIRRCAVATNQNHAPPLYLGKKHDMTWAFPCNSLIQYARVHTSIWNTQALCWTNLPQWMQLAKFECQQAIYNQHFCVYDCIDKPNRRAFLFEIFIYNDRRATRLIAFAGWWHLNDTGDTFCDNSNLLHSFLQPMLRDASERGYDSGGIDPWPIEMGNGGVFS